ncbi:MAG: TIGR00730 family Rossman fold protein [Patescibacteria group bacterium]
MKNVCVFLSASTVDKKYADAACELGELLVKNGYRLVYGGNSKGLMEIISSAVLKSGGEVIGVTMEVLKHLQKPDVPEMIIAKDLSERKRIFNEKSDAFVVMVGGIGTLDEATEVLELKKHAIHSKPIVFLNTDDFYAGLKIQLKKMNDEGFLPAQFEGLVHFAETPQQVIDLLHETLGEES